MVVSLGDPLKPQLKNTDSNSRDPTKMRESDEANNKRIILQRKFPKFKHAYTAIELIDEMHEKSQSKAND